MEAPGGGCRLIVNLLALAHERGCEAELATLLGADLAAGQLPDITALRARFAPDPAALPEIVVRLTPLIAYEALLGADTGPDWGEEQRPADADAQRPSPAGDQAGLVGLCRAGG